MGGSKSKSAITSLNTQITNIATNIVQSCVVNTGQTQTVVSNNTGFQLGSTLSVVQTTSISSSCFQDASLQANLQNQITSAIQQTATANGVALLGGVGASQSSADSYISNIIKNNVTLSNIQNNYNTITQNQSVTINNSGEQIFSTVDISQGATVFAAATLKTVSDTGVLNALAASIDQQSTATTSNPLDFIANIVTGVASAISDSVMSMVAFVIFVIIAIFYLVSSGLSTDVSTGSTDEEPQGEEPQGEEPQGEKAQGEEESEDKKE